MYKDKKIIFWTLHVAGLGSLTEEEQQKVYEAIAEDVKLFGSLTGEVEIYDKDADDSYSDILEDIPYIIYDDFIIVVRGDKFIQIITDTKEETELVEVCRLTLAEHEKLSIEDTVAFCKDYDASGETEDSHEYVFFKKV